MGSAQSAPAGAPQLTPAHFFETINAYQRTAALRAAIELDVFTAISEGASGPAEIAHRTDAAERGIRILCDFLSIIGFLEKRGDGGYALTPESAAFLSRTSPAYLGGTVRFLNAPEIVHAYDNLTAAVRKGGTVMPGNGSVEPDNPIWVDFARAMAPMMMMPARWIADVVASELPREPIRVLDIAAGHGMFGLTIAKNIPSARIVALDWPRVLAVASLNARELGVEDRFETLPGSAFETEFGGPYDIVLLTNFLHHFHRETCAFLLRKVRVALKPGGRAITLEFVPNEDRVTPPTQAAFAMIMLGTTPHGDAYTYPEYDRLFREAGFSRSELLERPGVEERLIVSRA